MVAIVSLERAWLPPSALRTSKLTAPDFERLALIPCPIASLTCLNQHAMPHQRPQLPAFLDGFACLHLSNDVVDQRRDCTLISIQRAAGGCGPP